MGIQEMNFVGILLLFVNGVVAFNTSVTGNLSTTTTRATPPPTPVIFTSGPVSSSPQACAEANMCFNEAISKYFPLLPWQPRPTPVPDINELCRIFPEVKDCYLSKKPGCQKPGTSTIVQDSTIASVSYVCTDQGKNALTKIEDCFKDNSTLVKAKQCDFVTSEDIDNSDHCSFLHYNLNCIINVTRTNCGERDARLVTNIIEPSIVPFERAFNCSVRLQTDGNNGNSGSKITASWTITVFIIKLFINIQGI
ncbi:hypothetical protein SNE40_001119 [Patella caerulea]|uniref:DUF19 domain-containing protein n=1 Tax=Patella caerulea TaxID=87958 RepID=A0AAN8Q2K0_PATCE